MTDTGINIKHEEFEGRASWGKTIPENDEDQDGNGHGSHVAGTMVGKTYGVAKKATIVAVVGGVHAVHLRRVAAAAVQPVC